MSEKVLKKIKQYLELDTKSNIDEECKLYAERLLEWINKWENQQYEDLKQLINMEIKE